MDARVTVTNSEASTLTDVQVTIALDSTNWDFTKTPHAVYASDQSTLVPFDRIIFDATNGAGVLAIKPPSLPVGTTTLYIGSEGPDQASYDNTFARFPATDSNGLIDCFHFDSNLNGAVNGAYAGSTTNATYTSGDGGKFGRDVVAKRFTGGHYLSFNGTDQYAAIQMGSLFSATPNAMTFALTVTFPPGFNKTSGRIFQVAHFGTVAIELYTNPSDPLRLQWRVVNGIGGAECSFKFASDSPASTSPGYTHHIACTYDATAQHIRLYFDGALVSYAALTVGAPYSLSNDGNTYLALGAIADIRPVEQAGTYTPISIDGLSLWSRELTQTEILQLSKRVKLHPVTTVQNRLTFRGVALDPRDFANSDNSFWEMAEPWEQGGKLHTVLRCGSGYNGTHHTSILHAESTDNGVTWGNYTPILGQGVGGYNGSPTCPETFIAADGSRKIVFARSTGDVVTGPNFDSFGLANYDGGTSATYVGAITIDSGSALPAGNSDMYYDAARAKYVFVAEIEGPLDSTVDWFVRIGEGTDPQTIAMFKDDSTHPTIFPGWSLGDDSPSRIRRQSSGPCVLSLADGTRIALLHDSQASVMFRRFRSPRSPVFDLYDEVSLLEQGLMDGLGTPFRFIADGTQNQQNADGTAHYSAASGKTSVYVSVNSSNILAAYVRSDFTGTLEQLFAPASVSASAEFLLNPAVQIAPTSSSYQRGQQFTVTIFGATPGEVVSIALNTGTDSFLVQLGDVTLDADGDGASGILTIPVDFPLGDAYLSIAGDSTDLESEHFTVAAASSTGWYYADQTDVTDLIGTGALRLISNEPGASTTAAIESARVVRTGQLVDALMDGELSRLGFTVPLANMSDATALILSQVNAGLVVRELNNPRAILSPTKGKSLSEIDKRLLVAIGGAENTWRRIKLGLIQLDADRAFTRSASAAVYLPTAYNRCINGTCRL